MKPTTAFVINGTINIKEGLNMLSIVNEADAFNIFPKCNLPRTAV